MLNVYYHNCISKRSSHTYAWDIAAMNPISELVKCATISSRMQRVEILPDDLKRKNTIIIESYIKLEFQSVVKYIIVKVQVAFNTYCSYPK